MTLEEFHDLCRKEWSEGHGEVQVLWLTEDSYRELQHYAMEQPVLFKEDGHSQAASRTVYSRSGSAAQVGVSLSTVINPVTKTPVRMKLSRDKDAADIWRDRIMFTKVL